MKKTIILSFIALSAHFATIAQFNAAEYLDINNVKARFMVHGDMFWNPTTGLPAYEFPKGSGKHSGHASSFWIGGFNANTNNLHLAAQTYRNKGNDYWPGPLDILNGATSDSLISVKWSQIWKVNRSTIDSFLQLSSHTISNTDKSILEWPGRKNQFAQTPSNTPLLVPDRQMAPFIDVNNDNIYNALDGDYPDIKGEQMLWWVFNDNTAPHTQSLAPALKIEIHAAAYACNQAGLDNTLFVNYKIFNFNNTSFDSTVLTFWNDIDLGYPFDDYIGYDSSRRMGIAYNGDFFDESPTGYGNSLTQKAVVVIKQPSDKINNRTPLGSFTYHRNGNSIDGDPINPQDYYNYMTGSWRDGSPFRKGCNPLDTTQAVGRFVFPDDPSNSNGISEFQCANAPDDKRFLLSSNPISLIPGGAPMEYTFAFINTDTGINNNNFNELRRLADSAYKYGNGCSGNLWPTGIPNVSKSQIIVYPNPARGTLFIEDENDQPKEIYIFNTFGQVIYQKSSTKQKTTINTQNWAASLYYLKIQKDGQTFSQPILIQ